MNLPQTSILISPQDQQPSSKPALASQSSSEFDSQVSIKEGRWSDQDSLRFVVFIHKYQEIFKSKHQRKSYKIFKHFSEYLTKRTPSQCRSHFQKLMLKHKTVAKLKREYRDKFGDVVYQDEMARLQEHLASKKKDIDGDAQVERKEIGIQTEGGHENHCSGLHSGASNFSFVYAMNGLGLLPFPPPTWASLNCPFL